MAFNYQKRHVDMLAKWIRYSSIPLIHKKKLCYEIIPQMVADNTSLNYPRFFTMATGERYRGEQYNENF